MRLLSQSETVESNRRLPSRVGDKWETDESSGRLPSQSETAESSGRLESAVESEWETAE